jgi:hypothetical protein
MTGLSLSPQARLSPRPVYAGPVLQEWEKCRSTGVPGAEKQGEDNEICVHRKRVEFFGVGNFVSARFSGPLYHRGGGLTMVIKQCSGKGHNCRVIAATPELFIRDRRASPGHTYTACVSFIDYRGDRHTNVCTRLLAVPISAQVGELREEEVQEEREQEEEIQEEEVYEELELEEEP